MTLSNLLSAMPKYVRVTGSYARGDFIEGYSDIDFYIPESKWEPFMEWARVNMTGRGHSTMPMTMTWYEPMMLEFSVLFRKQKNIRKEVTIHGRTFKTW